LAFVSGCAQPEQSRAPAYPAVSPAAAPATEPAADPVVPRIALSGTGTPTISAPESGVFPVSTLPPPRLTLDQLYAAQRESVRSTTAAPAPIRRVGALAAATAFDRRAWERDPDAYLSVIEPARVYQSAHPQMGVPATTVAGPSSAQVAPLASVPLQFVTAPHAPLTIVSEGLGSFPNGLTAITLRSDHRGVVQTTWTAIRGTTGDVMIVAASPLAVGQAHLLIEVL
jgi:hypothetical protein